jgi:hypothetical protein
MKNWISALAVFFLGVSLVGCSNMSSTNSSPNPDSSKEIIGLCSGAIIGGLAGSAVGQKGGGRVTAISLGAVAGAIVGFTLGKFMDDQDRDKALGLSKNQPANNWQQASHPLAPKVTTAANGATAPTKVTAEAKMATAPKVTTEANVATDVKILPAKSPVQPANDKKIAGTNEKPAKETNPSDKFLSLWRDLPSTQWFVNDMKPQDVG